jgi:lipoyl(octanoyl) transferase
MAAYGVGDLPASTYDRHVIVNAATQRIWYVLESGAGNYAWNMAMDEALLETMPRLGRPMLRFYGWAEPAASFGYFQRYAEVERLTPLRPLVRRPTGGGIVPHDADWTYSVVCPTHHEWYALSAVESYERVHDWILRAFAALQVPTRLAPQALKTLPGRCFAGHERSDLLWGERKIAGAAQRRRRDGLLIQGSVQPPPATPARGAWQAALLEAGSARDGICWEHFRLDEVLAARATELAARKYSQRAYNQKR